MNVVFITNGDSKIGFGHISRILVLFSFFVKHRHHVKIIVPKSCSFCINENFIQVKSLSKKHLDFIQNDFDVVMIDSVEKDFDSLSWLINTKLFIVSTTLFLFDFSKRYEHLSFFPSIQKSEVIRIGRTWIYLGNQYLTFREEFNDTKFIVRSKANKILITMGGTDPFGLTLKVVEALNKNHSLSMTVLLSEKAKDYQKLSKISEFYTNVSLFGFTDNIVDLFCEHDIALINGGLTRYETCVVGIPFISLSIHHKQFRITQELVDLGVGVNLGVYDEINKEHIYTAVKELLGNVKLRKMTSLKMRKLLDTKGVERIYNIICDKFREYEANNKMG